MSESALLVIGSHSISGASFVRQAFECGRTETSLILSGNLGRWSLIPS
jgi:hypothetical protein